MGGERYLRKVVITERGNYLVDCLVGNGIQSQHDCGLDGGRKRGKSGSKAGCQANHTSDENCQGGRVRGNNSAKSCWNIIRREAIDRIVRAELIWF